jgi:hypothetical protein
MSGLDFSVLLQFPFWVKFLILQMICCHMERVIRRFVGYQDMRISALVTCTVLCVIEYIVLRWD